jgi:ribosomal protein S17E
MVVETVTQLIDAKQLRNRHAGLISAFMRLRISVHESGCSSASAVVAEPAP